MAASKAGFMKDAFILFAITLVSGICLGLVYEITKGPIEQATIAAANATYREVLSTADSFDTLEGSEEKVSELNASGDLVQYGNVGVNSILKGTDANGNVVGYVINTYSNDGFNGLIELSVGVDLNGAITGVGFLHIEDTYSSEAQDIEYVGQFLGKGKNMLTVTKSDSATETEINAISGATITSKATTNAVNAALYYLHNYLE